MHILKAFSITVLSLTLAGCGAKHFHDTALYHPSGRAKPLVAVLPVINSVGQTSLNWDLAHEMTQEIRKKVADSSRIFLFNVAGASIADAHALNTPDMAKLTSVDRSTFSDADFVVVTELVDQNQDIKGFKNERKKYLNAVGAKISIAMRLRVIDLRGKEPRVVLQEVVTHEQNVGKAYLSVDYAKTPWGSPAFANTPLGMAHAQIVREVVAHVEGYIGL